MSTQSDTSSSVTAPRTALVTAAFLASDRASYVTGATIAVDGGRSAR